MASSDREESCTKTISPSLSQLAHGIADIGEMLQKIAQDLLDIKEASAERERVETDADKLRWLNNDSISFSIDKNFDLANLLGDIHSSLFGTVLLMRNIDADSALPGFAVRMLGDDMQKKLDLLLSAQNYCEEVKNHVRRQR